MVHNGIEYGDMQLICEAYFMLKHALGLTNDELYDVFAEWNRGELDSYLIEITRDIFSVKDDGDRRVPGRPDPGHGRRQGHGQVDEPVGARPGRAQHAGDRGRLRPLPLGAEGRPRAGQQGAHRARRASTTATAQEFIEQVRQALYASKICSYAQGFVQLQAAAEEHDWPLNFGDIALLWRGGCIIRAVFLDRIKEAFDADPKLENLLLAPYFTGRRREGPGGLAARGRPRPSSWASPCRPSPRRWPTTTATAASGCRPTCCRPSATTSAPTPTSASTSRAKARSTPTGCELRKTARSSRHACIAGTPNALIDGSDAARR